MSPPPPFQGKVLSEAVLHLTLTWTLILASSLFCIFFSTEELGNNNLGLNPHLKAHFGTFFPPKCGPGVLANEV